MKKQEKLLIVLCLVAVAFASCSITFYNQWHTTDSVINTENPLTNSADSSSISINIPELSE